MEATPIEVTSSERLLDAKEIRELPCTHTIREIVSQYDGIIMESEKVSHDHKFGYIYRYQMLKITTSDGSAFPDKGKTYRIETRVVVNTLDCKKITVATHPMFELPREQPQK